MTNISSIKRYLSSISSDTTVSKSTNSTYYKGDTISVRLSNHLGRDYAGRTINVIVIDAETCIISARGISEIHCSLKDCIPFLKAFLLINPYLKETAEVHNKLRSTISNNQKEISKLENTVKSLNNKLSQAEVFQALETRQIALSAIAGERGFFKQSLNTIIQRIDSLLIDAENLNAIKIKCQEFLK